MYIRLYIDIRIIIHMSICEASSHKFEIHLFLEKKNHRYRHTIRSGNDSANDFVNTIRNLMTF